MLLSCSISGLPLTRYAHFQGLHVVDTHPIFSLHSRVLWRLADTFFQKRMTAEERKLIFLAVANSTRRIKWVVPANPSTSMVFAQFQRLAHIASWLEQLQAPGVHFPDYIVRRANADMANFHIWLGAIEELRTEFYAGQARAEHKRRMMALQARVERKLLNISAGVDGEHSANTALAKWALQATEAPEEQASLWLSILTTARERLYTKNLSDIHALIEHFECFLPHGSIAAHHAMKMARGLLQYHGDGLGLYKIVEPGALEEIADAEVGSAPAAIDAAIDGPTEEPKPEMYPSKVAYSIAKARWILAQNARRHHGSGPNSI